MYAWSNNAALWAEQAARRSSEPHLIRPRLKASQPVHVVMRAAPDLGNLRSISAHVDAADTRSWSGDGMRRNGCGFVTATLDHSVATPNVQCGDFHVHTCRPNDSGDRALTKVAQAVADPVRSDPERRDFSTEIAALGVVAFAYSITCSRSGDTWVLEAKHLT